MDEYIKREDVLKALTYEGLGDPSENVSLILATARKKIRHIPTADVVPKSEVEALQAQIAQLQLDLHYSICREDEAVAKTSREIFAEIYEDCFDQFGYINYEALAELKKKYIPEKAEKTEAKEEKFFTPEDVRKMSAAEVRANYTKIINSMPKWH